MYHAINEYQLRLDVQCLLWPAYYINYLYYVGPLSCIFGRNYGQGNPEVLFKSNMEDAVCYHL